MGNENLERISNQFDAETHGHKRVGANTASSADQWLYFYEETRIGLFVLLGEALGVADCNGDDDIPAVMRNAVELAFDDGVAHVCQSR